ncbi:MAG: alanine racemase [Oscillospiraceae bacterium]|nr:alanine racemase [Oscillospiraceae bacterium]
MLKYNRRCWAKIDLDALTSNMKLIMHKLSKGEKPMLVVKADAYGCGANVVANFLQNKFFIDHWAVANIDEAIRLRRVGIRGEIIIFGYTPYDNVDLLKKYNLTQSIYCKDYAMLLSEHAQKAKINIPIHVAIDTGMSRVGFLPDENFLYYSKLPCFDMKGVFTHLCCADSCDKDSVQFTKHQIEVFKKVTKGLPNPHCRNSAAILSGVGGGFSYARPGIILYGLQPSLDVTCSELKPVMSFKTVVSMVKTIKKGQTVGYGRTFCANKETKVATLSVGYADGYSRFLSNKGRVLIGGKVARIIGNVCMDQTMIDVTGIDVNIGDVATLFGDDGTNIYTANDIANQIGTIGYEVTCAVSKRVPRVYMSGGVEIDVK